MEITDGPLAGFVSSKCGGAESMEGSSTIIGVDDPIGAVPVHALNGVWGTLAVGLFGQSVLGSPQSGVFYGGGFSQLGIQALGAISVAIFVMGSMWLVFKTIDALVGLRVSEMEELRGLDIGEHGMESYSGFQIFITE